MMFTNLKVLSLGRNIVSRNLQERVVFLSPSSPDVDFLLVKMYRKVTQEGPRDEFSGFKHDISVAEEVELTKETGKLKKI